MPVKSFILQLIVLFLFCLLILPAQGAINAGVQWDIRTTGSDTNGGGFDPTVSAPGTDESQGSGTAITITLTGAATGTASPAFTSTTHGPGNLIHIASGSGCSIGWYEINSVSGSTATFTANMGSSTNVCVGVIGGSLLTTQTALNQATNGNVEWMKSGTYTITSTITSEAGGNRTSPTIIGYGTTHGDGGTAPLITTATNGTILFQTANASTNLFLRNIAFSSTAATKSIAINLGTSSYYISIVDCTFTNVGGTGLGNAVIELSNGGVQQFTFFHSSIVGATGEGIHANHTTGTTIVDSYLYGGGDIAVLIGDIAGNPDTLTVDNTIIAANAGAGIQCGAGDHEPCEIIVTRSTIASNGTNGVYVVNLSGAVNALHHITLRSNIFYGNTGYGFSTPAVSVGSPQINFTLDHNAWGANTTAAYTANVPAGTGDKTLTATPFTNSAGQDFSLNTTAGGGALVVGNGYLGAFISGSTTSYTTIGAVQPASSSSSTVGNAFQ